MITEDSIRQALQQVRYPGFSRDIVSFGLIRKIEVEEGTVTVLLSVTSSDPKIPTQLKADTEAALKTVEGVKQAVVNVSVQASKKAAQPRSGSNQRMSGVKKILAVASGKGGVGKSTVTVNLAVALDQYLREQGSSKGVGIMDCDIYGPSIPLMMGLSDRPEIREDSIIPVQNFGIKVISMGLLVDENAPVVWRGPMVTNAIVQFAENVDWGELDILVVDLPPGTGDAQLSLVQTLPVAGALIVTTPQQAAVNVAYRGARMFDKVNVPVLGVAENMSYLEDGQGGRNYLFGKGGGQAVAEALDTELLAQIPLDGDVREGSDQGVPVVLASRERLSSQAFRGLAEQIAQKLGFGTANG